MNTLALYTLLFWLASGASTKYHRQFNFQLNRNFGLDFMGLNQPSDEEKKELLNEKFKELD